MKKEGFSTTVIADAQTGAPLIHRLPGFEPVYLSLFLLDAALQGKGLGTELYREFEEMQRRRAQRHPNRRGDDYEGNLVPFWKRRALKKEKKSRWNGAARLPCPCDVP
ncbi:MAG: hypothetical protein ACLRZH_03720 [Ruthenibacterium lactatiformans]